MMSEHLAKSREVVPAVAHCVIFEYKLGSHWSAKAQRERRGAIEFLICESANRVGCFPAVLEQELDSV